MYMIRTNDVKLKNSGKWTIYNPSITDEEIQKYQVKINAKGWHVKESIEAIINGKNFMETGEFKKKKNLINNSYKIWGYISTTDFCRGRTNEIKDLYNSIKEKGIIHKPSDPIGIFINSNGQYVLCNGFHRFFTCSLLHIEMIPVTVFFESPIWKEKLSFLTKLRNELWNGNLYVEFPHISLFKYIPIYTSNRFNLIRENTKYRTILDIGCLYGSGGAYLYDFIYDGIDIDWRYIKVGEILKKSIHGKYTLINGDIFNVDIQKDYDIIIAFNILTHFLRTNETYKKMINLLSEVRCKELFIQLHNKDEYLYNEISFGLNPSELLQKIKEVTNKKNHLFLGEERGRSIYKVW